MQLQNIKGYFFVIILSFTILFIFFGKILLHPNNYLFQKEGDAIKNYFTPAYFIKYDTGLQFSGMNYPYGEQITFIDNQPIVSLSLNYLKSLFPNLPEKTIGFYNLLMLLSIPFSVIFLYAIARFYNFPIWYATCIALIIGYLSPQLHRFCGHYGLTYGCFIPIVWYLLLRLNSSTKKYIWAFLLTLTGVIFSFLHVYYLPLYLLFVVIYLSWQAFWYQKSTKNKLIHILQAVLLASIPYLIFQIFIILTDSINDRPTSPYGFFTYISNFFCIFFPVEGPRLEMWNLLLKINNRQWEGFAYVGCLGLPIFILTLFTFLKYIKNKKWIKLIKIPYLPSSLSTAFWTGFILFVFSTSFPFNLNQNLLTNFLGPFKQFRSLGRFAWIFYYTFSIYIAYYLYLIYKQMCIKNLHKIANILIVFFLLLWAYDSYIKTYLLSTAIANKDQSLFFGDKNPFPNWLKELNKQPQNFQSILMLPFNSCGSEKLYITGSGVSLNYSFMASYGLNLPMFNTLLARTSIAQSLKIAQLFSNPIIEKKILNDLPNKKPILLMHYKTDALETNEQQLINKSIKIGEKNEIIFYELSIDSLNWNCTKFKQQYEIEKNLFTKNNQDLLVSMPDKFAYFDNLDTKNNSAFGESCLNVKTDQQIIWEGKLPIPNDSSNYNVSIWFKALTNIDGFPSLGYKQFNEAGNQIEQNEIRPIETFEIYENWVKAEIPIKVQNNKNKIQIYVSGKKIEAKNLFIAPKNVNVWHQTKNGDIMYNNFYLAPCK